jgi:hypothetical protein
LTVHVKVAPDVSSVKVDAPQPLDPVAPLELNDHETVSIDRNQPSQPPK